MSFTDDFKKNKINLGVLIFSAQVSKGILRFSEH